MNIVCNANIDINSLYLKYHVKIDIDFFFFLNKYIVIIISKETTKFYLWASFSKELTKKELEPNLPNLLQIQTGQKPLSENSTIPFCHFKCLRVHTSCFLFQGSWCIWISSFLFCVQNRGRWSWGSFFKRTLFLCQYAPSEFSMRILSILPKFL